MRLSKNTLTLLLMTGSILLVLILQFFWLRSLYRDSLDDLKRETGFLFERTIMDMQFSRLERTMEIVSEDSLFFAAQPARKLVHINPRAFTRRRGTDTGRMSVPETENGLYPGDPQNPDTGEMRMLVRADSAHPGDHLFGRVAVASGGENIVSFRLDEADTLRISEIEAGYDTVLTEAGIDVSFRILSLPIHSAARRIPFPALGRERLRLLGKLDHHKLPFGERLPLLPADSMQDWEKTLTARSGRENSFIAEYVFLPQTGSVVAVELNDYQWILIRNFTPQLFFALATVLFITVSFYIIYRSMRMQQRLMELKNEFVSNVTHELNTPIATVSSAIEALRSFRALDNPARTRDYLKIAQQELGRLTLLSDKILKAMVLEHEGEKARIEKINLHEIIREVLASMKLVFKKQKAKVTFETTGEDFNMEGEKASVMNVVYNLLDNSLKYSSGVPRISISLKEQPAGLLLDIRDQGIGIPQEFQEKVFEKFFRVPKGDIHNIKGYGLGLNYVDNVIKNHGGTISLESQAGRGSAFSIYLPKNSQL